MSRSFLARIARSTTLFAGVLVASALSGSVVAAPDWAGRWCLHDRVGCDNALTWILGPRTRTGRAWPPVEAEFPPGPTYPPSRMPTTGTIHRLSFALPRPVTSQAAAVWRDPSGGSMVST